MPTMKAQTKGEFEALCGEVEKGFATLGMRLRIALQRDQRPEIFLLYESRRTKTGTEVYSEAEAITIMDGLLTQHQSNADLFLEHAINIAAELRRSPEEPEPVVWSEPNLVISGIAPGILDRWRSRRNDASKEKPHVG